MWGGGGVYWYWFYCSMFCCPDTSLSIHDSVVCGRFNVIVESDLS